MKHYQLKPNKDPLKEIALSDKHTCCIYPDLFQYIQSKKSEIDKVQRQWDIAKKMSNMYEYIYTSSNSKRNISSVIPVSRSFFKLREIIYDFRLNIQGPCACIAEAPGGFIQSIIRHTKEFNLPNDPIYGITLISDDKDIPYWNPIISNHPRVILCDGYDKTGDLYKLPNVLSFIKTCGKQTCQLVTADGGFDYTRDFEQELSSYQLFYSEIMIALNIQKQGGIFVCKLFDIFHNSTLQLVYLLRLSYETITFIKPSTSRQSNSEKYIICQNFKGYNKQINNLLIHYFGKKQLPISLSDGFIDDMKQYQTRCVEMQSNAIDSTLSLIKKNRMNEKPSRYQLQKAQDWCKQYRIPINKHCIYT